MSKEKAVSKMNAEECLKELAAQEKEGVEFDLEYTEKTPVKELRKLVAEGRRALAEGAEDEEESLGGADEGSDEEQGDESDESDEEEDGDAPAPAVTAGKEPMLTVILKDGRARTYSMRTHGKHWQTLAKQLQENKKGSKLVKGGVIGASTF